MGIERDYQLKDKVEYKDIPFLVEVYDTDMYINAKTGGIRGINMHGAPTGMKRGGREWVVCECLIANIRPDYPYPKSDKYDGVDKHVRVVEPYEIPKRGIIFYGKEERKVDMEPMDLAEKAADKLKRRFKNYEPPAEVPSDIIG